MFAHSRRHVGRPHATARGRYRRVFRSIREAFREGLRLHLEACRRNPFMRF